MKLVRLVFSWIKKVLGKEKQPVSASIQVVNSLIIINFIDKD